MNKDWFRNEIWNESIEKEFFSMLSRARSQRDQYLVIQALTLSKRLPQISLKLVDFYFESKKSDFEDIRALQAKADSCLALKNYDQAIESMKNILAIEKLRPNQKTSMFVDYPYFVATHKMKNEYSTSLLVLAERGNEAVFPIQQYKLHAAKSFIHHAQSEIELAKEHAHLALGAAQAKKSGFLFHENLGLVGKEHSSAIKSLRKLIA